MTWLDELAADTAALTDAGRVRCLREIAPLPGARARLDGKVYLNFSSNAHTLAKLPSDGWSVTKL